MNPKIPGLRELARRFDDKPKRERTLIAATAMAALLFLADSVVLSPLHARLDQAGQQEQALAAQAQALAQQQLQLTPGTAPTREAELQAARNRVQPLAARVGELQSSLLASRQMEEFLAGLIPTGSALRIVGMKTLPVQDIAAVAPASSPEAEPRGVYRHGIELQVEGSYLELMGYVRRIERAPWRLVLDSLSIEAQQYPRAVLTLRLSTFSLEPQWLQLGS